MTHARHFIILLLCCAATALHADDFTAFVKHSSGLVMGNNGSGRVVLREVADAVPMHFVDKGEGWYNIQLAEGTGAGQFVSKTGSWNTSFVSSGTADEAQFRIEGDTAGLVKLVCRANSCCLGTDQTEAGTNVYSDKSGNDAKYYWFVTADINAEPDVTTCRFVADATMLKQTHEGWGVSLCWWANMCGKWSDAKIDKLVEWLVSPTGLNYNIFRYNIGGGDDPNNTHCTPHHMGGGKGLRAEMEGFKDSSDDSYHWERDAAQRKIMLKIREKRPDAIFEAFSNTPPWYMTYSGCCSGHTDGGKDNLKPAYYEEFANYLVDVCKHYKEEYDIEFRTLEPFNEATTNYWYCGGVQEGCHFDFASQIAFIKVLYPILKRSGLSTVISASDETAVWPAVCGFNEYKNAGILSRIGQWNTHTYYGSNGDRQTFSNLVRGTGKRLWMSETGSGGSGLAGNLGMAQRLIDDERYIAPDAWLDWQYFEENNDQWCLVQGSFSSQTYKKVKNYYVRQHFSRFIKQGYTFVNTSNDQTLAAISPEADTMVVVTLNTAPTATEYAATLKGVKVDGTILAYLTDETHSLATSKAYTLTDAGALSYKLPGNSIHTFVVPLDNGKPSGVQSATAATRLVTFSATDGTLHLRSAATCRVQLFTTSGVLMHSGECDATGVSVTLPRGIYVLRAAKGDEQQAEIIKN